MLESKFQSNLIKKIKERFTGAVVLKNDPNYLQGIPDLLVLYKDKWAMLEVKKAENSPHQPNQEYYVNKLDAMSYSTFISPENEEVVLDELQQTFRPSREACVSKCE